MSENVSTQFPNPPELQPLPVNRQKPWQLASYAFILAGLVLLGWGGWMYYRNWLEATQPPPARILEVSVTDLETPTPRPTPTLPEPAPTSKTVTGDTLVLTPVPSPSSEPTSPLPSNEAISEATATATATAVGEISTTSSANEEVLSLADNPLVVQQSDQQPPSTEIDAVPAPVEPAAANSSPLTRIVAESINLDAPVVEVGWQQIMHNGQPINVWEVAEYAAGWHKNSLLPGLGGNIVLSGHHNIKGEVFRYIVDLEPGAIISLYQDDQRYDYVVADKFIVKDKGEPDAVRRENAKWVGPFNDERLTMVTCWPYNNNTHRVIVLAKPVDATADSQLIAQPGN